MIILSTLPYVQAVDGGNLAAQVLTSIFTDFVPLLALFGQEVSKQYLSQSVDSVDDLLFVTAPLGLLWVPFELLDTLDAYTDRESTRTCKCIRDRGSLPDITRCI